MFESRPGLLRTKVYTQPSIRPGSVNGHQLRLGRRRQVWLIPLAGETQGVQVKLCYPLTMRAIPERQRRFVWRRYANRLLKKNNLDASQRKNFRPVSNLCYLSKLLETVVQKQLQQFLDNMMQWQPISLH